MLGDSEPNCANMTLKELLQTDYDGRMAALRLRDLKRAPNAPDALLKECERRIVNGKGAARELDARGVGPNERYC